MLQHKGAHILLLHSTRMGNARNLKFRGSRRDIGIQAGSRTRHQVDWDLCRWVLSLKFLNVAFDAVNQNPVCGSQIRAAA
jgi:hypothetical protein